MIIEQTLENMSVIDKATCLNLLRIDKYPATPLQSIDISIMFEQYNKETNMIIDSYMWKVYGLHYKDYIDTILASCGICTYDVVKLEKAIDKSISYYMGEK